jgi:adenosylhomocysteine nucleosidase
VSPDAAGSPRVLVIISANAEWRPVREIFSNVVAERSPYGEWFVAGLEIDGKEEGVLFLHGGWGKIAAAASAQYAIGRWNPVLAVNIGTCGGFEGEIDRHRVVLAERTLVYDIIEQMGDPDEALAHYSTGIDLGWLHDTALPDVHRGLLISADRDLAAAEIPALRSRFGAVAADWESGAIAYVAARNGTRLLILRGVSDLVGPSGGEAYGDIAIFEENTRAIMTDLVASLPVWIGAGLRGIGR